MQIKRIASEVLEIRDLMVQHQDQINYLENWLHTYGIDLVNPLPAPRKPPVKRRRVSESPPNHLSEWLQVKEEPGVETCIDCTVKIPDTYNQMVTSIAKRTRRSVIDIVQNFQFVDPSNKQEDPLNVPEIEIVEHDPLKPEVEEGEVVDQTVDQSANEEQEEKEPENKILDPTPKEPRRCAANFSVKPKEVVETEKKPDEEKTLDPLPVDPILEIIEFTYDE